MAWWSRRGIVVLFSFIFVMPMWLIIAPRSRHIYYQDPALFKTQRVVDRYIDVLAYTFEVPRAALNVVGDPRRQLTKKVAIKH